MSLVPLDREENEMEKLWNQFGGNQSRKLKIMTGPAGMNMIQEEMKRHAKELNDYALWGDSISKTEFLQKAVVKIGDTEVECVMNPDTHMAFVVNPEGMPIYPMVELPYDSIVSVIKNDVPPQDLPGKDGQEFKLENINPGGWFTTAYDPTDAIHPNQESWDQLRKYAKKYLDCK